jgi:hypothetical protein
VVPTVPLRLLEDGGGEDQAGSLAAEPPPVAVGGDDAIEDVSELAHPDIPFGDGDEVELIVEQSSHQGGAGADHVFGRSCRLAWSEVEELPNLVAEQRSRGLEILGNARHLVGELSLLDQQDRGRDLLGGQVLLGVLQRQIVEGDVGVGGQLWLGSVRIDVGSRADQA